MSKDQIAAEAALRFENQGYTGITDKTPKEVAARIRRHFITEIKSAIEKAYQQGRDDSVRDWENHRAAQGSEPWTVNHVAKIYAFACGSKSSQFEAAMTRTFVTGWQAIADAHNASIKSGSIFPINSAPCPSKCPYCGEPPQGKWCPYCRAWKDPLYQPTP